MKLTGSVLALGLSSVIFTGCGSSQSGTVTPVTALQSRMHRASGSSGDLLYVTNANGIAILSYPAGQIVGQIPWYSDDGEICSDPNNGNVFIPENASIYEYAHGGTAPIATLNLPSGFTVVGGCAVDPTTGNVAQIGWTTVKGNSTTAVLIFSQSSNSPAIYFSKKLPSFEYPAYEGSGNLFVGADAKEGAYRIGELKAGQSTFTIIQLSDRDDHPYKMQWDGSHLTFLYDNTSSGKLGIGQLQISGTTGKVINVIPLTGASNVYDLYYWIANGEVFAVYGKIKQNNNIGIGVWPYPAGGNPSAKFYGITKGRKDSIGDITVSVTPTASRK